MDGWKNKPERRNWKRKQSAIKAKIGVVWKHRCASRTVITILKLASCHVISIVSIFRCCIMKHRYVMSKISSAFHSQSPINKVSFSPYGTVLLTLLARIRTAAIFYYLNCSLYWQRCQVISVFLQSTFQQDVLTLTELWVHFVGHRPAGSFISPRWTSGSWQVFFRCIP